MGAGQRVEGIPRPVRRHAARLQPSSNDGTDECLRTVTAAGTPVTAPQMLRRYGASARSALARRSYDRIMAGDP
jgi:hypothetical protein